MILQFGDKINSPFQSSRNDTSAVVDKRAALRHCDTQHKHEGTRDQVMASIVEVYRGKSSKSDVVANRRTLKTQHTHRRSVLFCFSLEFRCFAPLVDKWSVHRINVAQ